jgi:Na+-translocating ferredoxin:NAD+ oxidoreductase RnfE subunit
MLTKLILLFILISSAQLNGVELKQIAVLRKPSSLSDINFHHSLLKLVSKKIWNGNLIIEFHYGGMGAQYAFVIHPSGVTTEIIPSQTINEETTKIIGTIIENNILKVINEKITVIITSVDSGDLQLKTLSTNGYQSVKNQSVTTVTQTLKQSADKIELIDTKQVYSSRFIISNHKSNGDVISKETIEGKYSPSTIPDFPMEENNGYSLQILDGLIYVFKIVNIANQGHSSGLSLKITASKSDSIVGTIQSSTSKDVRVQSSQNISDWMDIGKIVNPNGKEIIIPFSKDKEFIRIVE